MVFLEGHGTEKKTLSKTSRYLNKVCTLVINNVSVVVVQSLNPVSDSS